jgi:hypothetical protein
MQKKNTNDNIAEYVHDGSNEENADKVDSDDESQLSSRKTLSEIQNISIPLKRSEEELELAKNVKLKFVKCTNITINIAKE